MNGHPHDLGTITVLLTRLAHQHLPRTLALKAKVDRGERLDDFDISFLQKLLSDTREIQPLLERHPEYRALNTRLIALYKAITDKALQNEQQH